MSYFNEHQNEAFLENVFRANGMSFSNLIKNNGEEDIQASQRVDFRPSRNLLKGQVGDEINVLMAACAWNLRKWLVIATIFLFWQKLGLFFVKHLRFFVVLDKKQFC